LLLGCEEGDTDDGTEVGMEIVGIDDVGILDGIDEVGPNVDGNDEVGITEG